MESKQSEAGGDLSSKNKFAGEDSVERFYEKEKEKWRSKMIKVFGDLHPYNFCITYGHSDDRNRVDKDIVGRELGKSQPFQTLHEMCLVDKAAEEEFHELLSSIESEMLTPSLIESLEERKKECVKVLEQFDEIVALCEKYFELEYNDCRKRAEKQLSLQKPMLGQVKKYLTEVEEAGDREIDILKNNIANYVKDVGLSWSSEVQEIYEEMTSEPLMMEVWSKCAEAITSKDVRYTFLMCEKEVALIWKKAFEDVLMLSSELEKYRYNYNLTKSKLERAIYWMNRNYRENMPELTKTQRKLACFADKKSNFFKELVDLEHEIRKEKREQQNIKLRFYNKIASMKVANNLAIERTLVKHRKVFDVKKAEILEILGVIIEGDEYIHEEILNTPWPPMDKSFLKSGNNITKKKDSQCVQSEENRCVKIQTLHDDEFADAFRSFVSSKDFRNILNHIADELGYMLDFDWVEYAQKTLEIEGEIKWMELFKIFKLDFTADMQDLKEYMMNFCKVKDKNVVFDINGVIDGFLNFICQKRQLLELSESQLDDNDLDIHQEFWESVHEIIPKALLWDSVIELLGTYIELLQSRRRFLTARSNLVMENEELDKYLKNYYSYEVPNAF